ncbi:MAG: hypothetical protein H6721_07410 [Sandaracinus sp.]|nr:hypothetical protein [Sandaracinus sp.]MCB9616432.1 hypothetical protein [Sandaracinus sp.]MCB9631946.1 hypothetical protein [Sandaracinus sp.]
MIRIRRGLGVAPTKLTTDAPTALAKVQALRASRTLGTKDFDGKVYGHEDVKKALWKMQHGKCCFCEKEMEVSYGTVEHFRPKTSATDDAGTKREGYWWLAYEFENFYLSCINCNQPKGDYFPLASGNPLTAGTLPSAASPPEDHVFLDPGKDLPERHIEWKFVRGKGMVPLGKTTRGTKTIRKLKLHLRDELAKFRGRHYRDVIVPIVKRYVDAKKANDTVRLDEVMKDVRRQAHARAPYAAMARAVFRQSNIPL